MLISLGLASLLLIQPVFALNDGQQLVLEAWSLVNEGYVKSIPDLYKLEINSLLEL